MNDICSKCDGYAIAETNLCLDCLEAVAWAKDFEEEKIK